MASDDKDRDFSALGPKDRPGRKDMLEIQAENVRDDLSYEADTADIEQELERVMAEDGEIDADMASDIPFEVAQDKKGGGIGKFIAPVLVLAIAAGVAGYIVMNPDLVNRGMSLASSVKAPSHDGDRENSQIKLAQADISETLPQPTATQNNASPISPEPAAAPATAADTQTVQSVEPSLAAASPDSSASAQAGAATQTAPAAGSPTGGDSNASQVSQAPSSTSPTDSSQTSNGSNEIKLAQSETPAAPPALSAPEARSTPSVADPAKSSSETHQAVVPVESPLAPIPDSDKLKPVSSGSGRTSEAKAALQAGPQSGVSAVPSASPDRLAGKASDAYYDASAGVPSNKMAAAAGPRKVDPNIEPAQKFVVVSGVRKPTDSESVLISAGRALKLGRYDAALEMYNSLYAKNKRDSRILMGRAVAQQGLGQDDAAIETYQELLNIQPDATDALVNMLGLLKKKDPAIALQRMIDLSKKYPSNAGLSAQIGIAEGEAGNYGEAMRYLGTASVLDPANPLHPFNMAVLADRQGNVQDAIKFYEQALQVNALNSDSGQSIPKESIYDRLAVLRNQ